MRNHFLLVLSVEAWTRDYGLFTLRPQPENDKSGYLTAPAFVVFRLACMLEQVVTPVHLDGFRSGDDGYFIDHGGHTRMARCEVRRTFAQRGKVLVQVLQNPVGFAQVRTFRGRQGLGVLVKTVDHGVNGLGHSRKRRGFRRSRGGLNGADSVQAKQRCDRAHGLAARRLARGSGGAKLFSQEGVENARCSRLLCFGLSLLLQGLELFILYLHNTPRGFEYGILDRTTR